MNNYKEDEKSTKYNNINNLGDSELDNEDSIEENDDTLPTYSQVRIGNDTLNELWIFIQSIKIELKKFEVLVEQREYDYKLVSFNLLDKKIEPSRNLIEYCTNCDPDLPNKFTYFMNYHKSFINNCKRIDNPKERFHQIVLYAMDYLNNLQFQINNEVSICQSMRPDAAESCFYNAYRHFEDEKVYFMNSQFYRIERELLEVADEIESFWFGCTIQAMSEVKRANSVLEKTLKCCKKNIYRSPCNHLQGIFNSALTINPYYSSDPDIYYLEVKYGGF